MNIELDITEFISKVSGVPKNELSVCTEIYNSGIVSSLSILELMSYIENNYKVVIKPEKLVEDNFKDIGTIAGFVRGLLDDNNS